MTSEVKIINFLKSEFPKNIGDDAAIIPFTDSKSYVITKDLLLEDVHFRTSYYTPEALAHKSLHVNISDIISMGAKPYNVLLGLGIPKSYQNNLDSFLQNFVNICKQNQLYLIGGDTVKSTDKLLISITAIGIAENDNLKFRNNAQPEDIICVAGNLGEAYVGFTALEQNICGLSYFKNCFLRPNALINEGLWLGEQKEVNSMMDISDGLYLDLPKLCKAANVGAQIEINNLMYDDKFLKACKILKVDYRDVQLIGGEDYGLLFTINPNFYNSICIQFKKKFNTKLHKIGIIKAEKQINFVKNNINFIPKIKPFSHFNESL